MRDGHGIVDFGFTMNDSSEVILDINDSKEFGEQFRKLEFLRKYPCNHGGLISITEKFNNKISVVAQGGSVLFNGIFNFSWICKYQFFTDEHLLSIERDSPLEMDNLFQLLLTDLWLIHRINGISFWKNQITQFSKDLDSFQKRIEQSKKKKIEIPPLFEKSHFITEFTKMME